MIQTMSVTAARENWSKVVDAVFRRRQRVVLEKAGIPVAALVSAEDLERLRRYDAEREADFAVLDRIGAAFADVPADELEREVAKAVAEVRAERRAAGHSVSSPV
jgi:prevent-host-death family protein